MTTTSRCALAAEAIQGKLMKAMEDEGVVFTSKLYRRGRDDGRVEGSLHLLSRRLHRAPTESERAAFLAHCAAAGADRIDDLLLDLREADVAAWLASLAEPARGS